MIINSMKKKKGSLLLPFFLLLNLFRASNPVRVVWAIGTPTATAPPPVKKEFST